MECLDHAFWDIFIEMLSVRFCKRRLGCFYKASRSFSLFLCSLDTFVELNKPGKIIFCKNLYNNVIKKFIILELLC